MTTEWNDELRKAWADTWQQPHMQRGLEIIKQMVAPKPMPFDPASVAGMDGQNTLVIAAMEHNRAVGQHDVFRRIELIGKISKIPKNLPLGWSPEALKE